MGRHSDQYFVTAKVFADAVSRVGLPNKTGHPAQSHKRFKQVRVVSACGIYKQVLKHVLPCINGQTDACIFNIVTAKLTNAMQWLVLN